MGLVWRLRTYNQIIDNIKAHWNNNEFSNSALGLLFNEGQRPTPGVFFETYLSLWWWNRLRFRAFVKELYPAFDELVEVMRLLKKSNIFNDENASVIVAQKNPADLVFVFSHLQQAGILTQKCFKRVFTKFDDISQALHLLQSSRFFTKEYLNLVLNHPKPGALVSALSSILSSGLLTQVHLNLVLNHPKPGALAISLSSMQSAELLTPTSIDMVLANKNAGDLTVVLSSLRRAGLLTQENLNCVLAHENQYRLPPELYHLRAGSLT